METQTKTCAAQGRIRREILKMSEGMAWNMARRETLHGMDVFDVIAYFRGRIAQMAGACRSVDLEGQKKFFGRVLRNARWELLRASRQAKRQLHPAFDPAAHAAAQNVARQKAEVRARHLRRAVRWTLRQLSPASFKTCATFLNMATQHAVSEEASRLSIRRLARESGYPFATYHRKVWTPMTEEFKEIWIKSNLDALKFM